MTHPTDTAAQTITRLADEANSRDVVQLAPGLAGLVLAAGQELHEIDLEKYSDRPYAKTGRVSLADADSFVAYVQRHRDQAATTLWSDVDQARIVAVLDDHLHAAGDDSAGWARHRAVLQLKPTIEWQHWVKHDGRYLDQQAFAEHLEDGVDSIREPSAADMLEVAQSFHAKRGVNFTSSRQLSGEVQFAYEESVTAKAGQKGQMQVPEVFTLGLAPFEGCDLYEVKARLRYRIGDGHLSLGYRLIRADRVRRAAFDAVVASVTLGADLPVMAGTPRQ